MGKVADIFLDAPTGTARITAETEYPVVAELLDPPRAGISRIQIGDGSPIAARCTLDVCRETWRPGQKALVVFEQGDAERPIAVAFMAPTASAESRIEFEIKAKPDLANVDGKVVVIRGEERVELRCGKGSIVIRKDGKVIVRGTHLLSRSVGAIRLKGGHVDIN